MHGTIERIVITMAMSKRFHGFSKKAQNQKLNMFSANSIVKMLVSMKSVLSIILRAGVPCPA